MTINTSIGMDVTQRAMLVSCRISQWTNVRNDKKATDAVAEKFNIEDKDKATTIKAGKYLIDPAALKEIQRRAMELRDEHWTRTSPWTDSGQRILTQEGYFAYGEAITKREQAFRLAVADFIENRYEDEVAKQETRLNGLFERSQYPSKEELARLFDVKVTISPMPKGDDFRVKLTADQTAKIKAEIEENLQDAIGQAMMDVAHRIKNVVQHAHERLSKYGQKTGEGKATSTFRDTLVTNMTDLISVLPTLNITKDPRLDEITHDLRALAIYKPEELRDSETARERTVKSAEEILKKLEAFI